MDPNIIVTGLAGARNVGVRQSLLHKWRKDGWLDPETGDRKYLKPVEEKSKRGGLMYRLGDVRDAERETRLSPRSHRRPVAVPGHAGS